MADNYERELGWDEEISQDSQFVLLPEGDYDFTVSSFERKRYKGGDKIPACNMATVHLRVAGPTGESTVIQHNLILYTTMEWKLCEFFLAIGLRKHGEKLKMPWNQVTGRRGRCKIGVREYKGKDYNEIKKFYDPEEQPIKGGNNAGGDWKGKGW